MRLFTIVGGWLLLSALVTIGAAAEGNRLAYLEENDPYYVSRSFPKLITPQWVGEPGVEAVVVLAIDDMRGHEKWEAYLRPILERLKQIDGRAAVSIMTCRIDPDEPHLQKWLAEGVSLETHTFDHPCPLLRNDDFNKAKQTFDDCIDLLSRVPNSRPVAFRVPCCDSLNTPSPRFFAEIFNRTTPAGNFLSIDSSVFQIFTSGDPELPRKLVLDEEGRERFRRYVPYDRAFVNTIEDYPYPYVIGRLCWELPCMVPSDWEAQHQQKPNNPRTVADMQAAIDATVVKQGVFDLVFHPHGWIRNDQVVELIDHAVSKYGSKVKFLTFRQVQQRLDKHLLAGQPLRAANGQDNGVRLLDVNHDGYLDVVIGNEHTRQTRIWSPATRAWTTTDFPVSVVRVDPDTGHRHDAGVRFGTSGNNSQTTMLVASDTVRGMWHFDGKNWAADPQAMLGLQVDGRPLQTVHQDQDQGVRFRDLDGDGSCELLAGNPRQQAIFARAAESAGFKLLPIKLPPSTTIVDSQGRDAGLRFVDIDEDGHDDVLASNEHSFSLDLFVSLQEGWSRRVIAGRRGDGGALPMIANAGTNNGAWFHSRHLWVQNETTNRLENLVDRRSYDQLLADVEPRAKSAEASLASIVVRPGFRVEQVAAEPLVMDPIGFDWGPDGKLWVVEMADYPLGIDDKGTPGGRVRYLEDTDGDGRYDRSTLFLDGLPYPTGVMPWHDGVLITCAPELLYAEDTDGDGRADVRRAIYTNFSEGNPQHRFNGLRHGLDNWLHCGCASSRGSVHSVKTGQDIDISGRDFRIRPDAGLLETLSGDTQFIRDRDDWGNWFGNTNSNPMYHFQLAERYLRRNPHVVAPGSKVQVSEVPGAAPVFPVSRTVARFNDLSKANRFTSACAAIIYRDELLGAEFAGNSFVCEPVHNLVHREVVSPKGVTFSSRRALDEQRSEFLASRDNWFRPVMVRTGPDGALWVADMYRHVIEHPEWIPDEWQARLDLRAGHDKGRIYRVYPIDKPPRPIPRLDGLDTPQLVAALDNPSGTARDLVQQLLVHRNDPASIPLLERLSRESSMATCRLQALCALDGLNALDARTIGPALADEHPGVRRHAVRLAELLADKSPQILAAVIKLVEDPDAQVRLQVAYSLGQWSAPEAGRALGQLALAARDDEVMVAAVLSSVRDDNLQQVLQEVLAKGTTAASGPAELLESLIVLATAFDNDQALAQLLNRVATPQSGAYANWQIVALRGFLDGLARRKLSFSKFQNDADGPLRTTLANVAPMFAYARATVADENSDPTSRILCLRLMGRGPEGRQPDIETMGRLLVPQTPGAVQAAAVEALSRFGDARVAEILLGGWKGFGPQLRSQVLDSLLARNDFLGALLDQIERGQVLAAEIDTARSQQLLGHRDESVRQRAARLLASATQADRQQVVDEYRSALALSGDKDRGAAVFKNACSVCHRLGEVGFAIGPDLAALTDKSPTSMLTAIFDPNRAVEAKYLSYTAITTDGLTHTGMLSAETGTSVTLIAQEDKQVQLLRSDLEALAGTSKSLMPEGLEKELSPQNVADLMTFLGASQPARKTFAGNSPRVVHPEGLRGEFWLLADSCEIYGDSLVLEPQFANLGYWRSDNDHAIWTFQVDQPGMYVVSLEYSSDQANAGNSYELVLGGTQLVGKAENTGNWANYRRVTIGQVKLAEGKQQLVMRAYGKLKGALLDLKAINLRPATP